jgi:hypothetical protein
MHDVSSPAPCRRPRTSREKVTPTNASEPTLPTTVTPTRIIPTDCVAAEPVAAPQPRTTSAIGPSTISLPSVRAM